ncbi:hypothetical protein, partial [Flavobacterium selenitireducens]|uniref:hypothetical protein n=1 Tax=Flavobacterium selenitireducens TaxID=2722704 RepID=UPI001CC29444
GGRRPPLNFKDIADSLTAARRSPESAVVTDFASYTGIAAGAPRFTNRQIDKRKRTNAVKLNQTAMKINQLRFVPLK